MLSLQELDELVALAAKRQVLAKVVYHKLLDPDHKKLRTLVADQILQHVNNATVPCWNRKVSPADSLRNGSQDATLAPMSRCTILS